MTNPEEGSDSAAPKTNQVQEKEKIDETGGEYCPGYIYRLCLGLPVM